MAAIKVLLADAALRELRGADDVAVACAVRGGPQLGHEHGAHAARGPAGRDAQRQRRSEVGGPWGVSELGEGAPD